MAPDRPSPPADCVFRRSYYNGLLTYTIFPVAAIAALWLFLGSAAALLARHRKTLLNFCVKGSFYLLFLIYPSVSGAVLSYFACIQMGNGFWVMRYSQTTQCYTSEYNTFLPYAAAMVALYPFGVPFLFFGILYSLVRRGALEEETTKARFGFLYEAYEGRMPYFEVFELLRKLYLSAIAVYIFSGSPTQIMCSSFVAIGACCVVLLLRPYSEADDDILAAAAHAEIFLLLSLGNMLRVGAAEKGEDEFIAACI